MIGPGCTNHAPNVYNTNKLISERSQNKEEEVIYYKAVYQTWATCCAGPHGVAPSPGPAAEATTGKPTGGGGTRAGLFYHPDYDYWG